MAYPNSEAFEEEHLELQSWFWPEATRGSVEAALSQLPLGTFVVRPSSQRNKLALSHVTGEGRVGHALIVKQGDIVTLEETDREFATVEQLVGMLSLTAAPMSPQQKEALDSRRRQAEAERHKQLEEQIARLKEAQKQQEEEEKRRAEAVVRQREAAKRREQVEADATRQHLLQKRKLLQEKALDSRVEERVNAYVSGRKFTSAQVGSLQHLFADLSAEVQQNLPFSGALSRHDLLATLDAMGESPSENEINELMAALDANNDGLVTFDDFLQAVSELPALELD